MSFLRTIGCLALVALCLVSGFMKVQKPEAFVPQVMKGNLPILIQKAGLAKHIPGFKFGEKEAKLLMQAVGGVMVFTSVMIIVNLGRSFNAFLLALVVIAITVCQDMDINDPAKMSQVQQIAFLKNMGIVGGLLVVAAGSGSSYRRETVSTNPKNKIHVD